MPQIHRMLVHPRQYGAVWCGRRSPRTLLPPCRAAFRKLQPHACAPRAQRAGSVAAVCRDTLCRLTSGTHRDRHSHIRNARRPQIRASAAQQHSRRSGDELTAKCGDTRTPRLCLYRRVGGDFVFRQRIDDRLFRKRRALCQAVSQPRGPHSRLARIVNDAPACARRRKEAICGSVARGQRES